MKVAVLKTHSLSCNPIYEPLGRLGHEITEVVYYRTDRAVDHAALPALVNAALPDWALVIGQHDDGNQRVPPLPVLAEIARGRPTVHLCCDGSERVWWPQLESYRIGVPFALHVNIDGVRDGFFVDRGVTALCPIDDEPYRPRPRICDREIAVGFCGGWGGGHSRGRDVEEMIRRGIPINAVKRPFADYDGYRRFLTNCRCVWNHAVSGSDDHMHVKARVVETALAGALLLEQEGSPAAAWFEPGFDYLTWRDPGDVERVARWVETEPDAAERIAFRLTQKVIARHAARPFWRGVLALARISA